MFTLLVIFDAAYIVVQYCGGKVHYVGNNIYYVAQPLVFQAGHYFAEVSYFFFFFFF